MINAIFACDINNGIGYKGGLPWPHNSEDMKWFKESTRGDVVVMGRKTWESIGKKPLPKRKNIIISSERQTSDDPWVDFDTSVQNTLNELGSYKTFNTWIIGGATIYEQAMDRCEHIYMTRFKEAYECDTFISKELLKPFQKLIYSRDTDECTFTIWGRS